MNITVFNPFSALTKINTTASYYEQLRSQLTVKKIVGRDLIRVGRHNDGGYIMVDSFQNSGGVAYSFGISNDVSWDADMAARGYEIFMYDPTIDALPVTHEKFHFFREGIAGFEFKKHSLNTLEHFINVNGHADCDNMILKMDVEGAEWSFLATVASDTLSRFDQMTFEIHDLIAPKDKSVMNATLACLSKINRTHSLVHVHANNANPFIIFEDKILMPNLLELTYVKTANYQLADDADLYLPLPIDEPNINARQDIPLGFWNRHFNNVLTIT